ncbi:gamma-tubulin complex component 6 isoform X2 [Thrips palmi]|uniref:Gamma-tubulin complex component 6 isoform X2 n=1 Tax=Thrips palmi TaxID=161013 RepID=A0A6P8YCM8_THRPL|nr:gamma-tubulin complex component 6 isoform X2 [Thrips palmi]
MSNTDETSVYKLISRLSEILVRENNCPLSGNQQTHCVNKARSVIYGTILKKQHVQEVSNLSKKFEHMNPLSCLIAWRFLLSNINKTKESCELDDAIREAFDTGWEDAPNPVLRTLICLAEDSSSASFSEGDSNEPFSLSEKLGFTSLKQGAKQSRIYPSLHPDVFKPPAWMNLSQSASSFGGYATSFPFNKEPGKGLPLFERFSGLCPKGHTSERSVYQVRTIPPLTGPSELNLSSNFTPPNLEDEGYFTPITESANPNHAFSNNEYKDPTEIWSKALNVNLPERKTWESLGIIDTKPEPSFLSAGGPKAVENLSVLVSIYQDVLKTQHIRDPKPTSRADFTRDVFFLLNGLESSIFPFIQESDCFVVRNGIWLEGYSVQGTRTLCQDFLYCGTHFRRLEKLSHSSVALENDGLIICALLACVQRWTQFYRGAVLILSSHVKSQGNSILLYELLEHIQSLKNQVQCLSTLCRVDGMKDESSTLPSGVALLAHIYREACKSNNQQSNLLYSALKSCCEVYLHCLGRWIFLGDCTDKTNEFFVRKDIKFSGHRDRSFWVQGFILDKKAVPGFLQGLETAVFDCGRAMNLLQLCSPQHPLCVWLEKEHPTIHCCLYKSDLGKVQKECAHFEEEAQRVCGELLTASKLFQEESDREAHLHVLMQKAQKQREAIRASLKMQLEREKAEMKEKQNADLKAQIQEVQLRKAAEKEKNRIEDELYLLQCKRLDEAAKFIEEEERLKMLAHYEELGKIVDKQNQHREWQLKRLKMADVRQTFLFEDSLSLAKENLKAEKNARARIELEDNTSESQMILQTPCLSKSVSPSPSSKENTTSESLCQTEHSDFFHEVEGFGISSGELLRPQYCENVESAENCVITSVLGHASDEELPKVTNLEEPLISLSSQTSGTSGRDATSESKDKPISDLERNRQRVLTQNVCWNPDKIDTSETDAKCGMKDEALSDLAKTRQRVLFQDWRSKENVSAVKNPSVDSGVTMEWERNRQKVLGEEFNILTGIKSSEFSGETSQLKGIEETSHLSDLQKNRRRVLGEEYNILTGEKTSAKNSSASIPAVMTTTDSGVGTLTLESECETQSNVVSETLQKETSVAKVNQECESTKSKLSVCLDEGLSGADKNRNEASDTPSFERPKILPVVSNSFSFVSPLTTPLSHNDMPVFTNPFRGTNSLPNELPLTTPLTDFCGENPKYFEVCGMPLTYDIADNFALKFDTQINYDLVSRDTVDHKKSDDELSKALPNTSWIESSLQTCLLLPLRVQYKFVSAALLHHFLVDLRLLSHFRSLRSYYFMQDGEFGRHLTVKLFTQMYQVSAPHLLFNPSSLERIMKEALASSQGTSDPNHHLISLTADRASVPHHFSHSSPNVLDFIQLSYKVKWPLNLILTPDVLQKYNVIFLFVIRLKRVAWLLQEDFVALKNTARGCFKEQHRDLINSPQYHQVQMIRQNMSQFLQATLNYVSSSVLYASWADFASSLKQATTLDHIYNAHIEYIKRLLKRCLLNTNFKRVEGVLSKILVCIIKFHSIMRTRPWQMPSKVQGQRSIFLEHPNFQQLMACSSHFKMQVCKLISYLERSISPPNHHYFLSEYLLLLNINGFYKSSDYITHAENVNEMEGKSSVSSQPTSTRTSHVS